MTRTLRWVASGLALLLLTSACSFGTRFNVPSDEYAAYRRVRLQPRLDDRLHAGLVYLHSFPKGVFRAEVRSWFARTEEAMRVSAWHSVPRLNHYLQVLPDSPHSEQVRARLELLQERERSRVLDDAQQLRVARERLQRLADAETSRSQLQQEVFAVVGRLARFTGYDQPFVATAAADDFYTWFTSGESPGVCDGARCSKAFRQDFLVPGGGSLVQRTAAFDVLVTLESGRVRSLTLTGFAWLDHIAETIFRKRVAPNDLQAHAEAIGQSVQFLALALHPELPESECAQEAVSPTLLKRLCRGRQAELVVGADYTEADRLEFSATPDEPRAGAPQTSISPRK